MHSPPDLRPLAVSALIVDPEVQRALDMRRVENIAENLNMDALGTITVSHRKNGSYHVIDGQHRVAAVRLAGGVLPAAVLCRVFDHLSLAEEAALFRLLNNTAKPQAVDLFRIRVVEGEPVATAIAAIIEGHGLSVSTNATGGHICAVAAMERIYRRDPDALDRALATCVRAWGLEPPANDGRLVEGLGLLYARYGSAVEVADLVPRLAKFGGGPGALLGKAAGLRDLIGCTAPNAVAEVIVESYNRGKKTRALQPWRSTR
jgi:hypothetical protein